MNEIWIRSIARAGGIEMPASVRVLEPRAEATGSSLRDDVSGFLRQAGNRLIGLADRVRPSPGRAVSCS